MVEITKIARLANRLDSIGLTKEADILDSILLKIAQQTYVISDPKNPGKKIEVDHQIFTAMQLAKNKVPSEFVSWVTDGTGGKNVRAFFSTDLWNNAGLDYIEKLQPGGSALTFYRNLIMNLQDFPHNDTKSKGGQIRYNLDKRFANLPARYYPNNFGEKVDRAVTDFMANKAPEIDTGDEILNKTLSRTPAENWNSLPDSVKGGIQDVMGILSYIPVIGIGPGAVVLATHIYEGKWDLVATDLFGMIVSFLVIGKAAEIAKALRATAPVGMAGMSRGSLWRNPEAIAAGMDLVWNEIVSIIQSIITKLKDAKSGAKWIPTLILTLESISKDKEKLRMEAWPRFQQQIDIILASASPA